MEEEIILNVEAKGADEAAKDLDKVAKSTNKADKAAEEYNQTLLDSAKDIEFFGVSLNGISSAFKGTITAVKSSITSLKAFKIALVATGVGAFVVVLGSLIAAFSQTQKGMDLLEDATTALSAVFQTLKDNVEDLGQSIANSFALVLSGQFSAAWNELTGSVVDLTKAMKEKR